MKEICKWKKEITEEKIKIQRDEKAILEEKLLESCWGVSRGFIRVI